MYTIISLSRRTKEGERFSKQERNRWFRRIGKSTLIPFPFFFLSFSRENARKQFWRNFRGWIIHGQLVDAWTFSCKLFNNLENRSILSTFFHFWTNGVENLDAKLPTRVSLFFPFFPFLLHSIPVIRIIKFDRERVAQIRWNYFFCRPCVNTFTRPGRTNFHECCRVFWTIYACNVLVTGLKPILRWKFQPHRRSINSIIRRFILWIVQFYFLLRRCKKFIYNNTTNHNDKFINNILDCRKLERSLIRNLKCRSSFIPVSFYSDSCFFSTYRSSSPILSSIF